MQAFSLVMELKDPSQLKELTDRIAEVRETIDRALQSLDYVHSSRFVPIPHKGLLLIVTEFDGDMADYVLDFAVVLDKEFSMILSYMKDCPPLPVSRYPQDFWHYVRDHQAPKFDPDKPPRMFSPHKGKSVLDIAPPGREKQLPTPLRIPPVVVDTTKLQANLLQGYGARRVRHVSFHAPSTEAARHFLDQLLTHATLRPTPQSARETPLCVTIGWTFAGLQALDLPPAWLDAFPAAFREGAARRAKRLADAEADADDAALAAWRFSDAPDRPDVVHGLVSLHLKHDGKADCHGPSIDAHARELDALMAACGLKRLEQQDAAALDNKGGIHFRYQEGFSQPQIDAPGFHYKNTSTDQKLPPGDFLLGRDFMNSRGGSYMGALPSEVADHGTYAVFRVIRQDVDKFENWLDATAAGEQISKELIAAKLMGRWRADGAPLAHAPYAHAAVTPEHMNAFDFAQTPASDAFGQHCPFGAHIRRLAPRAGMVVGVPWGRTVLRRGLPYGPPQSAKPDDQERGLAGMFICGDIESQFEFLMKVWAKGDLSAPGLRGTMDPISIDRSRDTPFHFHTEDNGPLRTVQVPPLTRTMGCLYLFMPGLDALRAMAPLQTAQGQVPANRMPAPPRLKAPLWPNGFTATLHRLHHERATQHPLVEEDGVYWVFSHALVQEVCARKTQFLKLPHKPPQEQPGLFHMNPPRHATVRAMMDNVVTTAIAGVETTAHAIAKRLLAEARPGQRWDVVKRYTQQLPKQVFMDLFGVGDGDMATKLNGAFNVLLTVRQAEEGSEGSKAREAAQATIKEAMGQLLSPDWSPKVTTSGARSFLHGLRAALFSGAITPSEAGHTATHFGLGGYLSTEFLLSTGILHLAKNPAAWSTLKTYSVALLDQAVHEMLRYDAPFQVAERYIHERTALGAHVLEPHRKVIVVYGSANHDPAVFRDPERFDITRTITPENLGFGDGIHYCIGADMARRVARVAFQNLLTALPEKLTITHQGNWSADPYFRYLDGLELAL